MLNNTIIEGNYSLKGKSVLITGGTGSFGQKFTEIALRDHNPSRIIIFSRDEWKQAEMRERFKDSRLDFFIGDIRSPGRLNRALALRPDIIVHAAALKRVESIEYNPFEAIETNVIGAKNLVEAAIDNKIKRIIGIGSDKGCSPHNTYGATKLLMEKLLIQGNSYVGKGDTRFSCVRYGNVMESRGGVLSIFRRQAQCGLPLSVTDKRMTRFWFTLEEAVNFIISSIYNMIGGEIFIPILPSFKIIDLAKAVAPKLRTEEIGIRPGERLHEILLSRDESRYAKRGQEYYVILPQVKYWRGAWSGGEELPEGFHYSSDTNDKWLTDTDIYDLLETNENL